MFCEAHARLTRKAANSNELDVMLYINTFLCFLFLESFLWGHELKHTARVRFKQWTPNPHYITAGFMLVTFLKCLLTMN